MSKWWWKADYIESCNCAHGCSCNLTMIPTDGTCQAIDAWKIREGAFDTTQLDGLGLALILRWPNPIHRGGLTRFIAATAVVSFLSTNARTRHSGRACLKLAPERQAKVAHSRFSRPRTPTLRLCASDGFTSSVKDAVALLSSVMLLASGSVPS